MKYLSIPLHAHSDCGLKFLQGFGSKHKEVPWDSPDVNIQGISKSKKSVCGAHGDLGQIFSQVRKVVVRRFAFCNVRDTTACWSAPVSA